MRAAIIVAGLGVLLTSGSVAAQTLNGFDLRGALVAPSAIQRGGPPKDGIPAIDRPKFVPAGAATLDPGDRILGVVLNGRAKAYPVRILNWHEVVNDRIGGVPVAITYCPLCGSGVTFAAKVEGRARSFGVSGLLYNSDVLLYDRETNSLWSQVLRKAITGPASGEELEMVPTSHTSWEDWRTRHPETLVLSEDTGFARDYSRDPYAGYDVNPKIFFPVANASARFDNKEVVVAVELGGRRKAYPFAELAKTDGTVSDSIGGHEVRVEFDRRYRTARVLNASGKELPSITSYWFAWYAFYPSTEIFYAPNKQ